MQVENLYSLSGVVHGLSRSVHYCSAPQPVNNAVASWQSVKFLLPIPGLGRHFRFGSGTNKKPARWTSLPQLFDRSRNPSTDTHSQVLTPNVPHYTACAPRSQPKEN
jgi:hypothetical protein